MHNTENMFKMFFSYGCTYGDMDSCTPEVLTTDISFWAAMKFRYTVIYITIIIFNSSTTQNIPNSKLGTDYAW